MQQFQMSKEFLSHLSILLVNYDNFGTFLHGCEGKSEILDRVWDKQKGKKNFLARAAKPQGQENNFLARLRVPHKVKNVILT